MNINLSLTDNLDMAVQSLLDSADYDQELIPMTIEDANYLIREWYDADDITYTAEELMNRWNEAIGSIA